MRSHECPTYRLCISTRKKKKITFCHVYVMRNVHNVFMILFIIHHFERVCLGPPGVHFVSKSRHLPPLFPTLPLMHCMLLFDISFYNFVICTSQNIKTSLLSMSRSCARFCHARLPFSRGALVLYNISTTFSGEI